MSPDPPAKGTRRATRIGKYEVVAHVASGGMGAVYRAVDTELHREVALKVLSPEMAANPAILERFRREARHAAKLHHENIVTLYEFGEVNGTYFLAMEFVEGIDLHDYINRKGQLDPEEARLILIQACQALDHAHKQGIIHRDVKPSNFLLTRKDGRLVVKLTDMGLARETRDEEFRVTRDGSTVGTVDYLSPEQARDSGSADARSDIYSLGCTVYHMLAGRPPFPSGGLAERIYKHIHTEPPDIRQFNLQVSDAFWAVLKRMLAKDPARRYQSAMDLLKEVLRLDSLAGPGRQFDENAGLVEIEEEEERPPSRASVPREDRAGKETGSDPDRRRVGTVPRPQAARVQKRPRERQDTAERPKPRTRPMITRRRENWLWPVLVALGVLIMGAVLGLVLWQVFRSRPLPLHEVGLPVVEPRPSAPDPKPVPPAPPPREAQSAGPAAPPPRWPALYQPTAAIDPGRLREEFEKPWAGPLPPEPDTVLRVSRVARPGSGQFESLAAACAAAPVGRVTVIEICDHGPLFETPVAVADRSLILRAAPGCRPLLVWDTARPPLTPTPLPLRGERGASGSSPGGEKEASGPFPGGEKEASGPFPGREKGASGSPSPPGGGEGRVRGADDGPATPTFLSVSRGSLTLQGLDLAVSWDDSTAAQRALLVRVADGDFLARDCTFSQTGYLPGGTVLVRFEGQEGPGKKCRLSRCYARGAGLVALDLDAPGAEVLLDGCLIAGGEPALLQVSGTEALPGLGDGRAAPTLRVLRSTLVCDRTLLQIRPVSPADRNPALNWMAWDALLARWGEQVGGAMVAPVGEVGTEGLRWQAINCLYAGWRTLLAGRGAIPASNWEAWQRRWQRSEGDAAVSQRWPAARPAEPAEVGPEFYRPEDTPAVAFAAMSGPGLLGCDLSALPPVRDNWLSLTFRGFAAPPVDLLADGSAPEIPAPGDDLYHGERLDLSRIDLGAYLQQLQKSGKKLGPRVVLHLTGSGERPTSPIRLKGTTLVLYFEPPEKKPGEPGTPPPLVLTPPRNLSTTLDVLIDVEDGDLEVIGGEIRFPDSRLALVPRHLLRVRRGNLLLYGCRLQGPVAQPPESYGGLIRLEGPCEPDASAITGCAINRSILLSGKAGIEVVGTGVAVRLQQCILATRQEAFRLDLGGAKTPPRPWARLKVRCLLENTTVAAPRAVIHLADAPQFPGPAEPAIFQTRSCAFLNPFTGSQPAVLLFEGDALTRGLLVWQGEGNAYDGRLSCYVLAKDAPVPEPQPYSVWTRLWGAVGDRQAIPALPLKSRMEATTLAPLDSLALTGLPSLDRPPGANLTLLGIVKSSRPPR